MASTSGPFGFVQYYESVNEPVVKYILDSFIEAEALFTYFPMITEGTKKKLGKRIIGLLPAPTWLPLGVEPPTPFVQDFQDYEEGCFYISDNFDMDYRFKNDKNYVMADVTEKQIEAYIKGRAFDLNYKLINNDHVNGNAQSFVGIKWRLENSTVYGNNAGVSFQASTNLATANLSVSNNIKLQRDIDQMLDRMGCGNGDGVVAMMSPQVKRQIDAVVRTSATSGGFEITKDAFGRTVTKYKGVTFVSVGYQAPTSTGLQTSPIIADNQDINGYDTYDVGNYNATGAVYSTIFFVWGGEEKFAMWQDMDPVMLKETRISGLRKGRIQFDMSQGIWNPNTRALGRIYGIATDGPTYS